MNISSSDPPPNSDSDDTLASPPPTSDGSTPLFVPSSLGNSQDWIGPYRILKSIGEGAMGVVFAAERREPVHQRVALKVIKRGIETSEVLGRFEVEHRALSIMEHPNIARVLDAGSTDDGRPYFVMEYVAGVDLVSFCDRERLSVDDRLGIFMNICRAVQHAHQKSVIHRDLKPSNILVARVDGRAVPKVIDFGVAKATAMTLTERTLYTEVGTMVGTPEYMSPEQAEASMDDCDSRTDVYSLGVILYELLVGVRPFDLAVLRPKGVAELQRVIREVDPPKPSTRMRSLGAEGDNRPGIDHGKLARRLQGDLDWITMKALEKSRDRRYASASELAADVQRHLDHEAVVAGPPRLGYRLGKGVRRHRVLATSTALVFLAVAVGFFATLVQYRDSQENLQLANARHNEIMRLADVKLVSDLLDAAEDLLVGYDRETPVRLSDWLDDVDELLSRRFEHEITLGRLRLEADQPGASRFLQWRTEVQADLCRDLETLELGDVETSARARVIKHREVLERSLDPGVWEEAAARIGELEVYGGLKLRQQPGLLPLGQDPSSGLWEFWHVGSGARPERDLQPNAAGSWRVSDETGIVLVLIPASDSWIGAQNQDLEQPNYDPEALEHEGPPAKVSLDAFFVSKYELTQSQWSRLGGGKPAFKRGVGTAPVEWVSWEDCEALLSRHGLVLPTEAQWEYSARAGTSTPWWTGANASEAQGSGNIDSRSVVSIGGYPANPFGLHDVHGNVAEWCKDRYEPRGTRSRARGNGETLEVREKFERVRVFRGGSFSLPVSDARVSCRNLHSVDFRYAHLGVRPAKVVH